MVGWTGGYVLIASLIAPYLRKFGCYTVPDYIGTRYGGNTAGLVAVIILVVASFTYVTAQINATGKIASRALQLPFEVGVWVGLLGILFCSMLGGMRAVTWTQVAHYIVLIIAYLVPVFWMSNKQGFSIFPQIEYGAVVASLHELEVLHKLTELKPVGVAGLKALTVPTAEAGKNGAGKLAVCYPGAVYDGGYGVTAAHPDAVFHPAVGTERAPVRGVVAAVHLPAVFHRTNACDANQAAGAGSETGYRDHRQGFFRTSERSTGFRNGAMSGS